MTKAVIALDIGGTKIHAAAVSRDGQILRQMREEVAVAKGPEAFFAQINGVIEKLSAQLEVTSVGIGCAGPLDGKSGELLDPTNFITEGKSWGRLNLVEPLKKRWKGWTIQLENDAAAAVLGEAWLGGGERENLLVMTLGTGVGVGVLVDGGLARTRAGLHPEASHIPLNCFATEFRCGCGNFGCVEAYLAGRLTVQRLAQAWREPSLTGQDLVQRAAKGDAKTLAAFEQYGEWLAQAIHAYAVLYGPKQISLSGGFAAAAEWFLPSARKRLPELLKRRRVGEDLLPRIAVSRLGDNLGVLGAARVAILAE